MKKRMLFTLLTLVKILLFSEPLEKVSYNVENFELDQNFNYLGICGSVSNNKYFYTDPELDLFYGFTVALDYELSKSIIDNKLLVNLYATTDLAELFTNDPEVTVFMHNKFMADLSLKLHEEILDKKHKVIYRTSQASKKSLPGSYYEHYIFVKLPTSIMYTTSIGSNYSLNTSKDYAYDFSYLGTRLSISRISRVNSRVNIVGYDSHLLDLYTKDSISGSINLFLNTPEYRNYRVEYNHISYGSLVDHRWGLSYESPIDNINGDLGEAKPFILEAKYGYGFSF